MNIKKPLLVAGAVTSISAAGLVGNNMVSAATTTDDNNSLVTKIAQKFNLKTEDVQAVFDADKQEKNTERQANLEKELSQLVTDGKLTAEQKDKIIAKQKELQANRETNKDTMKDKTEAERKSAMGAKKAELEKWASDNGIPTEYLRFVTGGHGGHGPGGPYRR
jgi:Trk K+ transport system NAD-binding subunit